MSDQWGPGDLTDVRFFDMTRIGSADGDHGTLDLFHGQHPHSRRDNNTYARDENGEIYGFDGHLPLIDVVFRSYNYLKQSGLSGDEIRKAGQCTILSDREPVYSFFYRDISWALRHADHLLITLSEHSSFLLMKAEREKLVGRKIYYRRTPAVITRLILDQGCVIVEPEAGHSFPPPVYAVEDGDDDASSIKDDILSHEIWWHRK